ncbi:MAG: S8 family serine peptidase [Kiritimatiellae bacterium]|nr:S8 family serine peptidase [Kiritimatiellia bacterium]
MKASHLFTNSLSSESLFISTSTGLAKTLAWIPLAGIMLLCPIGVQGQSDADPIATLPVDSISQVTTGSSGQTFDVNALLGAYRYYGHSTPITGQNSVTTNLEAGHIWNGHETLKHVNTFYHHANTFGTETSDLFDRHATWAGMLIGGRVTGTGNDVRQQGIAPGTDLRSAAIATHWSGNAYALSFGLNVNTVREAYHQAFSNSDVVNSSYGFTDPAGSHGYTLRSDGMAYRHSTTLHVVSAGNSGSGANTVGSPGSGYNSLAVGALSGGHDFNTVASFSSRSPQDFSYYDITNGVTTLVTIPGVRAAVDLVAPGAGLTSAYYGGQTGGNHPGLNNSRDRGSDEDAYSNSINGTSFSAPLVAGGASLLVSAAKTLPELSNNPDATQSMVIKSLLMTGAAKTEGWDNGMTLVNDGNQSYSSTTQSLDWAAGAGRMDLDRTFDIQVNGQTGVGAPPGSTNQVFKYGWDYGFAGLGMQNDYILYKNVPSDTPLTVTLAWMRARDWEVETDTLYEIAQANLDLSVWLLDEQGQFDMLIAQSASIYNNVEHLHLVLPQSGQYGLRVTYTDNVFDNSGWWGSTGFEQDYGLSWDLVAAPEPGVWFMFAGVAVALFLFRRRPTRRLGRKSNIDR